MKFPYKLTPLGKVIIAYLCTLILFGIATKALCVETTLNAQWVFNGSPSLNLVGFKIYQEVEGNTTPVVVATINDPEARSYIGPVDAPVGRSYYTITAFTSDAESRHSAPKQPFEVLEPETSGILAPTVIIHFQ